MARIPAQSGRKWLTGPRTEGDGGGGPERGAKVTRNDRESRGQGRTGEMARLRCPPGFVICCPETSRRWHRSSWEGPADTSSVSRAREEDKGAHTLH